MKHSNVRTAVAIVL